MIRIQNIYYMLSYAFQVLNEQGYKQVATEEFDNVAELCAAILIKGVSLQIKRGLGKEYVLQTESLSALRGKIDISASVKEQSKISTDNRVFLQSVLNFFMRIRYRIHTVYRIFFLPISTQK